MKVKVVKIGESAIPQVKSGDWGNYSLGQVNPNVSIPIEYELEGELVGGINVGDALVVARTSRNGIPAYGVFCTSTIKAVAKSEKSITVETNNSFYLITEL